MAPAKRMPRNLEPMLARPAKALPGGDGWAYEIKWDGIRALTYIDDRGLRIAARRGADHTPRYPEFVAMTEAFAGRELILDGEIVAFDASGRPSFQLLQRRMGLTTEATIRLRATETPATYVAFDLLWLDGESLCAEPYLKRREALADLGFDGPHWQSPAHHVGDGGRLWEAIRKQGLEGVVAKRLESPYRPGARSGEWLKVRYRRGQELVIGGWMPGEGTRGGTVGSLLLGYWDSTPDEAQALRRPQKLVYAGGVGTGYTQEMLKRLTQLLKPLERPDPPFELGEDPVLKYRQRARDRGGGPRWVEPELVCEVEFTEWTREGTLRQSAFKGLRDDKDPREVVRES
jgi:bifunctional non-homologous end joining protein LigD